MARTLAGIMLVEFSRCLRLHLLLVQADQFPDAVDQRRNGAGDGRDDAWSRVDLLGQVAVAPCHVDADDVEGGVLPLAGIHLGEQQDRLTFVKPVLLDFDSAALRALDQNRSDRHCSITKQFNLIVFDYLANGVRPHQSAPALRRGDP
jgi:hypothetical protein